MKIKNIALTISFVAFTIGFSDLQENMVFWLGRPVGAIAFIVFFICTLLEKEYALLDEQERVKFAALGEPEKLRPSKSSTREDCAPALTTAVSH